VEPTLLIAGPPRSGTTLVCELLNRLPDVRALDEPLQPRSLLAAADGRGGLDGNRLAQLIATFVAQQRRSLRERGEAVSKHVDGRIIGAKVSDGRGDDGLRRRMAKRGIVQLGVPARDPFVVAVKQPVAFTALIPLLASRLAMAAVVRNPLATLASWESVPMKVRDGRSGMQAEIAPGLGERLAAEPDRVERQLVLLDWLWARIAQLPSERIVRYEDVVATGGAALAALVPSAAQLRVALTDRNGRLAADPGHMAAVAERLLARDAAYWRLYDRDEVRQLVTAATAARNAPAASGHGG
jgi:hypothetical protein